jgi:hypothetical protein
VTPITRHCQWLGLWLAWASTGMPAWAQDTPAPPLAEDSPFVPLPLYSDGPDDGFLVSPGGIGNLPAPRQTVQSQLEGEFGVQVNGKLSVPTSAVRSWDEPLPDAAWTTEEGWRWELPGPISFFGQLGANGSILTDQEMAIFGKTGVLWKLPTFFWGEYQLRGGPTVTCTDPLRPVVSDRRSELFVQLDCKWPLPWQMKLEYQGYAVPALLSTPTDRLNQDLRLAFPLGDSGSLKLGAKHNLEYPAEVAPIWINQMELYVGLSLTR